MLYKGKQIKTYTQKSTGDIREVGSGRLIRKGTKPAAARPGTKAPGKTFTDGQGIVRTVGSGIATNPLDAKVDAAILAETQPLTTGIAMSEAQYNAEQAALNQANTAANAQIKGISGHVAGINADQLGAAARAAGGTQANHEQNLNFLQSLLGNTVTDGGAGLAGVGSLTAAQNAGEGQGAAQLIRSGGLAAQADFGGMMSAGSMRTREDISNQLLARDAAIKQYRDKIGAVKANRADIRNDLYDRELAQRAARQQLELNKAEFKLQSEGQAAEIDLAKDELAADTTAANKPKPGSVGKYGSYSVPKKYDVAVDQVLKMVENTPAAKQRWRNIVGLLTKRGVPGGSAVLLATAWAPHRAQDPYVAYKAMKDGSLGFKVSDVVAKRMFKIAGIDWAKRNVKPGGRQPGRVTLGGATGAISGSDLASGATGGIPVSGGSSGGGIRLPAGAIDPSVLR